MKKMAVAHKIGLCDVGQTSVIIAVSSAHRREALEVTARLLAALSSNCCPGAYVSHTVPSCCLAQACHWAIDELKAKVPIWKKECYEGGEVWKENTEAVSKRWRAKDG